MRGLLLHCGLLGLLWAGGAVWCARRRAWAAALGLAALAAWVVADGVRGGFGPPAEAQWAAVAALVASGRPAVDPDRPPWGLSLLPLLIVSWEGLGAVVAAVLIAATGALEAGRQRRWWLLGGLVALVGAAAVDDHSLALWIQVCQLGLGMDAASAVVDGAEQAARMTGWAALLGWLGRSRIPR